MRPFVVLCAVLLCPSARPVPSFALPASETLYFNVEWRLVNAGKAKLTWTANPHSRPGWQAVLHLESAGLISKLFKVNDDYTAILGPDLCAFSTHLIAREGKRQRETRVTFDRESRRASHIETDLLRKNAVVAATEADTGPCVHDVIGALFYLRTLHLEPGQSAQVPVSDGKKFARVRIEAQTREEVRTAGGPRKTIRYEAFVFNNVLYRRQGHLQIWLGDDARRLPVQIKVRLQFTIGTIGLQLEREEKT